MVVYSKTLTWRVKLRDNPDSPEPGVLDDLPDVILAVHVSARVVSALVTIDVK